MLEVANIEKRFGGLVVLSGVSFALASSRILGLIGPNGAGKTTLFNILTGFVRPNAGTVSFDGRNVTALSPERRNRLGIARTFQVVKPFARLTVLENVMVGAFAVNTRTAEAEHVARQVLDRVGLGAQAELGAASLTLADRKRMEIARCLATQPRLLLMDEAMCGLNLTEMQAMIALVRSLRADGLTVILVEHIMDAIAELADEVVALNGGLVLAQGTPAEVLGDPRVVEAYLGERLDAAD
ncbi:MAG: ABC transporter ATP-binding protein [Rhodospirillaceae bacterium]|nr:ABC transporter ATP-binding protein [Rhodospirillaceae bacterium]